MDSYDIKPEMPKTPVHGATSRTIALTVALSVLVGSLFGFWGGLAAVNGRFPTINDLLKIAQGKSLVQASSTATGASSGSTVTTAETSATTDVVKKAGPAVVSVILTQDLSKIKSNPSLNPFNDFFFSFPFSAPQQQPQTGTQQVAAGSGFLVTSDGLVVTNKHVVQQAIDNPDLTITVVFNDASEHAGKVLASDPLNDLAIVKIDGKNLPTVTLGDSNSLQLGQTVIAIGNALGDYPNTVTQGVISGIHRTITAGDGQGSSETIQDALQTDAAINHGNSGGPLLNLFGQVIGINTAIDEQGQLVGFAIPINNVKQVIESVEQGGKIVRPYLGVRYVMIDNTIKQANNLTVDYGALVTSGGSQSQLAVIPGSPADKAGLVENDIILEVNGTKVDTKNPLSNALQQYKVSDTLTLKILHKGDQKTVQVKLEEYRANKSSTNTNQ